MISWWNGFLAVLDLSNTEAVNWFQSRLDFLQQNYQVDGFKLDAGDFNFYPANSFSAGNISCNEQSRLYAAIGLKYPLNEYRACWKMGGQPLVQRLRDKDHSWTDMQKIIPGMTLTGLTGYTFSCPDIIGGGEINSFWANQDKLDQDLVVRSAQCHALMPMMQFSVAPWRVLNTVHLKAVKKAVDVRMKFTPLIMQLVRQSAQTGEPVVKSMEYVFPDQGFAETNDQFMLGDNILVAPMVMKGNTRTVKFPKLLKGKWKADDGKIYKGGSTAAIEVLLERLPYFEVIK
jgi:alpha-glucosidase (family GH31 glycosyl hydrolase)